MKSWAIVSYATRGAASALLWIAISAPADAQTVWTGPMITFTKPGLADPAVVHDHLTDNVQLARGNTQALFNLATETSFNASSPLDTEWATDLNNPSETIAATNWAALDFDTFSAAYANSVGNNVVDRNAVVHLISDGIYLDLRFSAWGSGNPAGGSFAYVRSTPVPEPAAAFLLSGALTLLVPSRVRFSPSASRRDLRTK